jgi:hypothetical protein
MLVYWQVKTTTPSLFSCQNLIFLWRQLKLDRVFLISGTFRRRDLHLEGPNLQPLEIFGVFWGDAVMNIPNYGTS